MPIVERSELHVEGRDDVHVVKHLLLRHRIDCPLERDSRPAREFAPNVPKIRSARDRNAVLDSIEPAVRVSNGRSVGFLLDSDGEPRDRWRAVCDRLRVFELDLPDEIPPEGFVGDVAEFGARVGVWLMPDNQREGALEQFLADLVDDNDALLPIAERSTAEASRKYGAEFPEVDCQQGCSAHLACVAERAWIALRHGHQGGQYLRVDSAYRLGFRRLVPTRVFS